MTPSISSPRFEADEGSKLTPFLSPLELSVLLSRNPTATEFVAIVELDCRRESGKRMVEREGEVVNVEKGSKALPVGE